MSNHHPILILPVLLLVLAMPAGAQDFKTHIADGDQARAEQRYEEALSAFQAAHDAAANNTDRGIAMSKRAYVYCYGLEDYASARGEAEAAMALEGTLPVARVSAMQVLAVCLMRVEEDYDAAIEMLDEALELEDVDWAQPVLHMVLGDCYRFSGRIEEALATYHLIPEMDTAEAPIRAVAFLNIGITYQYNLQRYADAKEAYATALEHNPGLKSEIDGHLGRMP